MCLDVTEEEKKSTLANHEVTENDKCAKRHPRSVQDKVVGIRFHVLQYSTNLVAILKRRQDGGQ